MYEAFYGLNAKPFQLNPDPTFYFGSRQHSRAKAYLEYGVSRSEGFIVITGEIGAGKTTLLRALIDSLHGTNVEIGHLVTTQLGAEDTLRMVGSAFGFLAKGVSKSELLVTLEAFLLTQLMAGKRCLLIVDEAQNLTPQAVEELRMLSNFQHGNQALLQTFLVGQPEFREILQRAEMEQFKQRVSAVCHIGPMERDETQRYIEHRLQRAGSTGLPSFEPAAFDVIHQASRGIPRRINKICDRLLLLGFLSERTHLRRTDVDEVLREFAEEGSIAPKLPTSGVAPLDAQTTGSGPLSVPDVNLGALGVDPEAAKQMGKQVATLLAEERLDHVLRLERSMLRLERLNVQILGLLQRMLQQAANRAPHDAPNP